VTYGIPISGNKPERVTHGITNLPETITSKTLLHNLMSLQESLERLYANTAPRLNRGHYWICGSVFHYS